MQPQQEAIDPHVEESRRRRSTKAKKNSFPGPGCRQPIQLGRRRMCRKWTEKYARGRTDADFADPVGPEADQVFQRRRVWETFADVHAGYASLKWSHFYAALTWDDAPSACNGPMKTRPPSRR